MSGIIIPIIPKQIFNFSFLAAATAKAVVLHEALNTVAFKSAWLLVRVHDVTMTSGQSLILNIYGTAPSPADPQEFTDGSAVMSVTIASSVSPPQLYTQTNSNLPAFLKIGVIASQAGSSGAPFYVDLSADLVLREV